MKFVLVDDYTRKISSYFLNSKDQVTDKFKEFKAKVENETGVRIKVLRTDNDTEFIDEGLTVSLNNVVLSFSCQFLTCLSKTEWQR